MWGRFPQAAIEGFPVIRIFLFNRKIFTEKDFIEETKKINENVISLVICFVTAPFSKMSSIRLQLFYSLSRYHGSNFGRNFQQFFAFPRKYDRGL